MQSDKSEYRLNPVQLVIFDNYATFMADLYDCFKMEYLPVALYGRLMEKTSLVNKKSVHKHVQVCLDFFRKNKDAVLSKKAGDIVSNFQYNETIYVDIKNVIENTEEKDVVDSIWRHLLKLLHVIDPECEAKIELTKEDTREEVFLNDMFNKIQSETKGLDMEGDEDPLKAMSKMMNSGVITDIMKDMNDNVRSGKLDIGKMMGMVSGLLHQNTQDDSHLLDEEGGDGVSQGVEDLSIE